MTLKAKPQKIIREEKRNARREKLEQILREAEITPSYLLAKEYNYTQSGMINLLRRNGLTPIKRQPPTHCECGNKIYVGKHCRECYNFRNSQRYKKHRISGHKWKFNSYEPSCLLPENLDANLHKHSYRIIEF